MQYYSKTPQQLRDELDDEKSPKKKKRRFGRILLFIDIILIVVIFVYVLDSQKKKDENKNNQQDELLNAQQAVVFHKDSYAVKTHCDIKLGCAVEIKWAEQNTGNAPQLWQKWQWQVTDHDDKQILFESSSAISLQNGVFVDNFKTNLPPNQSNRVYAKILDGQDKVIIRFRVFPR